MGTIRIISPMGAQSDIGYEGKEPPIEILQKACGGYVEHFAAEYEGKRRSIYMVDPFSHHPKYGKPANLIENPRGKEIIGMRVRGPIAIDLGRDSV